MIVHVIAGLVQLVSASSPSHQVLGSKPSLCRISAGVRLCLFPSPDPTRVGASGTGSAWDYYNCVELDTFIEEIVVRFDIRSEDGTLRWLFFFLMEVGRVFQYLC
jgi:hypothetical protein